jgi:hypothetical protein
MTGGILLVILNLEGLQTIEMEINVCMLNYNIIFNFVVKRCDVRSF